MASNISKGAKQLVKRYQVLPKALYRIQGKLPVKLRDYDTQMAKGRTSYDLKLHNGKVMPAEGDEWIGPNGMSLRPPTDTMLGILDDWRKGEPTIFRFYEGMRLYEDDLVLIHERDDHYSLQTTVPIELQEFNDKLTKLLEEAPKQTVQQFRELMEDEDDQDNWRKNDK